MGTQHIPASWQVGQIKKEGDCAYIPIRRKRRGRRGRRNSQGIGCPKLTNHVAASSAGVIEQLGIHHLEANMHEASQSTRKLP
jgi:hypothetical protein